MESLHDLTIVIPTRNRPLELERSIKYWRDTPITIHIIDGSDAPSFPVGVLSGIPTIFYHYVPLAEGEDIMVHINRRLVLATTLPITKYSAICCDDDFYTVSGLVECVAILNLDENIDAVAGRVASYKFKDDEIIWKMKYLNRHNSDSAKSPDIRDRINSGGSWFLYGITRTELWRHYIRISYDYKSFTLSQHQGHEFIMIELSKAMFRTKIIERVFSVRQATIQGANLPPKVNFADWFRDKHNFREVEELISQFKKGLVHVSPSDDNVSVDNLAQKIFGDLGKYSSTARVQKIRKTTLNLLVKLLAPLPLAIRIRVNKVVPQRFRHFGFREITPYDKLSLDSHDLEKLMIDLSVNSISVNPDELRGIERLLLKPRDELRLHLNAGE